MRRAAPALAAVLGVAAVLCAGCGPAERKAEGGQGWVTKGGRIYKEGDSIVIEGVGAVQGVQNVPLARETAESRARADVASRIETVVTRLREDFMSSVADLTDKSGEEQLIRVTGKELVTQVVAGCEIVDRFQDEKKNVFYAYAKLDIRNSDLASRFKGAVRPAIAERIKQNAEEAFKRLDQSVERYLKDGIPAKGEAGK